MEMDMSFFLIAGPAVAFAGLSKGGFGSGPAFMSSAILALVLDPSHALGIMLPLLMLMDVAGLKPYWKLWDWVEARRLILGAIPGVALAAWLYRSTDADVFRLLIGGLSIGFVLYSLATSLGAIKPKLTKFGPVAGAIAGCASGFTSFVSHAGGPPSAIYLLSQKLDKTTFQATTVVVFWAVNIFKAIPYAFLGIFTYDTLMADIFLAPFALFGVWVGVKAHHAVPERLFFGFIYVMLLGTGAKLIFDALV